MYSTSEVAYLCIVEYCNDRPEAALNGSISSTTLAYYQAVGTNTNVIYNLYA